MPSGRIVAAARPEVVPSHIASLLSLGCHIPIYALVSVLLTVMGVLSA